MKTNDNSKYGDGTLTGVFYTRDEAENAYNVLIDKGYSTDEIILLMSDETHNTHFKNTRDDSGFQTLAMEKAGLGSAIGGTAGAVIGAIAAVGTTIALPGLGLVVAGPIVAALSGAGAGGLAGGIIGGLVGSGINKEHATMYEDSIKRGGVVIGIVPRSHEDFNDIKKEWEDIGGENIQA